MTFKFLRVNQLVDCQRVTVNLQATRCIRLIRRPYLVKAKQSSCRIIKLIMINLMRRKRCVKGQLDIRDESGKFQHRCRHDYIRLYCQETKANNLWDMSMGRRNRLPLHSPRITRATANVMSSACPCARVPASPPTPFDHCTKGYVVNRVSPMPPAQTKA